uniref:Phospholipase B1, membrane-associated-like n=1 Tax=Saccoglossus kowalevskii TaxID=10224 RepID=A0ABM0MKE5_SACKO|nr:PREDICTED: phospholipase B1, membrane-associated-like [Saccoglossus kowalevskii]
MKLFLVFILTIVSVSCVEKNSTNGYWERFSRFMEEFGPIAEDIIAKKTPAIPRKQDYTFDCEILPPSDTTPTSVHKLRPADIDVVAALGDSLTAANGAGASNPILVLREYRGLSFSIGGDDTLEDGVLTLPNILKQYNSEVTGWSEGIGRVDNYEVSRLNVAVPGGKADDMYDQTVDLINRLKTHESLDYENDWKMVTLFIGGNDLCAYCHDPEDHTAEQYTKHIKTALDLMHAEMPRTFVNLAQTVLVTEINKLDDCFCDLIHLFLCDCAKATWSDDWQEILILANKYHRALEELVEDGRYDTREDFTVVIQPFFEETRIPPDGEGGWDDSFFAPDCFHFSEYGHQECAKSLWNNLIEPVGQKRTAWHPDDIVECPSEDFEFFYTYKNSDKTPQQPEPVSQAHMVTMTPMLLVLFTATVLQICV